VKTFDIPPDARIEFLPTETSDCFKSMEEIERSQVVRPFSCKETTGPVQVKCLHIAANGIQTPVTLVLSPKMRAALDALAKGNSDE